MRADKQCMKPWKTPQQQLDEHQKQHLAQYVSAAVQVLLAAHETGLPPVSKLDQSLQPHLHEMVSLYSDPHQQQNKVLAERRNAVFCDKCAMSNADNASSVSSTHILVQTQMPVRPFAGCNREHNSTTLYLISYHLANTLRAHLQSALRRHLKAAQQVTKQHSKIQPSST